MSLLTPPAEASTAPLRQSERKRRCIVAAALGAFRSKGFAGCSMDGIAAAAAVSKRTVYNHFPSKDELFAEVMTQLWEQSQTVGEQPYDASRPLREQLQALLGAKLRLLSDASFVDLARVAMAEMIHTPGRARDMVARLSAKEQGLADWIVAAQADGRLRASDPQLAAAQLQGLVKSFAFWPQLALGQPPLDAAAQAQLLNSTADLFLSHYAVPGQR